MTKKVETKEIMPLENINAVTIFKDGGLDNLLTQITKEASSHVPDLTTDKGRKDIASIAYKVSQSKTLLDDAGKKLVAGAKAEIKLVDAERKRARDTLDTLRDDVRKPLNDWEAEEELRVEGIMNYIQQTIDAGRSCLDQYLITSVETMQAAIDDLNEIDPTAGYDEFEERMTEVKADAVSKITRAIEMRKKHDADQAELDNLRKEKEARDEKDRLAKEKTDREKREKEIADKARKDAEAKAKKEKADAEQRLKDEQKRAADEKTQAEGLAKAAAEKAEKDKQAAVEEEKQRQIDSRKAEADATAKREADTKHRKKINNAAVDALVKTGITKAKAVDVVTAIAKGQIPNVKISY